MKRQFNLGMRKQYDSFEKDIDLYSKFYRKTSLDAKDDSEVLEGAEITKYRSIVGRLMYMAGERPVMHSMPSSAWPDTWQSPQSTL